MTLTEALAIAGEQLQARYGSEAIPRQDLVQAVVRLGSFSESSVLPSDYCYNLVNRADFSFETPLFIREQRGHYRYVGPGFAYSGPIYWKPRCEPERQVGEWTNGTYRFTHDPRL